MTGLRWLKINVLPWIDRSPVSETGLMAETKRFVDSIEVHTSMGVCRLTHGVMNS